MNVLNAASCFTLAALTCLVLHTQLQNQKNATLVSRPLYFGEPARIQKLDLGVSWAQGYGIGQGFAGEPNYYPYVETPSTSAVLETENKQARSTEARYPFVKYYGQAVDFIHGNTLDASYYNYDEPVDDDVVVDNTLADYSKFIGLKPEVEETPVDLHYD
jgi:hypothetical protein